jgi:hypothetical protein
MKKIVKSVSIAFILISLIVMGGYKQASAKNNVADGSWNTGTVVSIDLEKNPSPDKGLQLFTEGVSVKQPTELCHPFRGGQFHWVPEIRQLVKGKWVKLATTSKWQTSEEGIYVACAAAPSAGTYALFAYYNGPAEHFESVDTTQSCSLDKSSWQLSYYEGRIYFIGSGLSGIPSAHYKIINKFNVTFDSEEGDGTLTWDSGHLLYVADLTGIHATSAWTADVMVSTSGCSSTIPIEVE